MIRAFKFGQFAAVDREGFEPGPCLVRLSRGLLRPFHFYRWPWFWQRGYALTDYIAPWRSHRQMDRFYARGAL